MSKQKDYFGLGWIISVILAIIPPTSWICGVITRLQEKKYVAAIIRLFLGFTLIWIVDIIMMITRKEIWRVLNV